MDATGMARFLAERQNPWKLLRRNTTLESFAVKHAPALSRKLLDEAGKNPADYGLTVRRVLGLESPEVEAARRLQAQLDARRPWDRRGRR
jgi:hypothetical protein